ncbi:MAG: V-type ATP synthase subunit I [Halobacteriales archaeon SW_9_67_25]|nr:MAG: V-type ATP synthase subunit I [Halobacteriales archaeon SW_9_67_25]
MLRPERMSRVSVTGSKPVMDDVIEVAHDLGLLHVTEYDGTWEGFEPGDPIEGADEASGKLVTVRALKSTLGVTGEDVSPTNRVITEEALGEELEAVRADVNELDDRHDELRDELRDVEERIDLMEPFVALGIDLDLLSGYDSLSVRAGDGDPDSVQRALADSDVDAYETYAADDVVAVFAYTDDETLSDILVDATFTAVEIPDGEGDPESYVEELRHRERELGSKLSTVEDEMEVATTENAFVAEGWLPTDRYDEFEASITDAVGDHVEIAELERADYDEDGHPVDHEEVHGGEDPTADEGGGVGQPTAANGRGEAGADAEADAGGEEARTDGGAAAIPEEARADGGMVTMGGDDPPVVQNNPAVGKPFEMLVRVINRPKYTEFDPTFILLLTFPAMFGFMIGDVAYGLLYVLIGWALYTKIDSSGWQALGGLSIWSGAFTMFFGLLYGEFFGLHFITSILWEGVVGLHGAPMHKGLQPVDINFARAWLVVSFAFGLLHLTVGYALGFLKELRHGARAALTEKGSWVLLMGGVWLFIFSTAASAKKPAFMFSVFGAEGLLNPRTGEEIAAEAVAYPLGFTGFPEVVGLAGLGLAVLGLVLLLGGEGIIGLLESLNVLVNVLSYARIPAVLLAKAGMAFVVNLLFFGAYTHHGEFHFLTGDAPGYVISEYGAEALMFPGLIHMGIIGILFGVVVFILGHLLVLALGVTSAGLQAVRLEYVEFFGKFYDGGGDAFVPFGHERTYTAEE